MSGFGVERAEGFEDVCEGSPEPRGVEERGGAREEIRADGVGERARLGVAEDDHGARGLRRGEAGEEVRAVPRRGGEGVRERGEVVVVAGGIAAAAAAGGGSRSRGRRRRGVQRGVDERVEALLVELEDDRVGADALDDRADLLRGRAPGRVHRADDVELAAAAARVHARHRRDARREVERRGVVRGGGGGRRRGRGDDAPPGAGAGAAPTTRRRGRGAGEAERARGHHPPTETGGEGNGAARQPMAGSPGRTCPSSTRDHRRRRLSSHWRRRESRDCPADSHEIAEMKNFVRPLSSRAGAFRGTSPTPPLAPHTAAAPSSNPR